MGKLIEKEIAGLINQSEYIAEQVRQEQWDTVEELTVKRQSALEKFFDLPVAKENIQLIERMIRKIMKIDHGLVEFIEQEKKNTFNNYSHLQHTSKANKAYQSVAVLNIS